MEFYGVIYSITNKIDNKVYIGQSIHKDVFKYRYDYNIYKSTNNPHLKRAISKYGIENFELNECIDTAYSKEHLDELEVYHINKFNSTNDNYGYNLKLGGANGKLNQEVKDKISLSQLGENNSFHGKTHTDVVKQNISNAHRKQVYCENGKLYKSVKEASDITGIHKDCIARCARGKYETAGGFKWSYNPPINGIYPD